MTIEVWSPLNNPTTPDQKKTPNISLHTFPDVFPRLTFHLLAQGMRLSSAALLLLLSNY